MTPAETPPPPAPTAPAPTAPAPTAAALWIAVGVTALAAAVIGWHLLSPASAQSRAQTLAAELGAETFERPLTEAELNWPVESELPGGATATTTLRQAMQDHDAVLLHFWASWCPPCLQELPQVASLAQSALGRHCAVVAVSYDDNWQAINATFAKLLGPAGKPPGTWLRDPQGQDGDPAKMLRVRFGTEKLPETWVLAGGRVKAHFIAGQAWTDAKMQRWLAAQCPRER